MPLEPHWVTVDEPEKLDQAREMFQEYQAELGIDLGWQGFQEELASLPGKYGAPRGSLMLVYDGPQVAACGALRDLGENIAELKRLYVRPAYRGAGLGRQVTERLLDRAAQLGYQRVRLDTLRRLIPAISLYHSLGFQETEPYNDGAGLDILYLEREL